MSCLSSLLVVQGNQPKLEQTTGDYSAHKRAIQTDRITTWNYGSQYICSTSFGRLLEGA
jgi:hypothetical protein